MTDNLRYELEITGSLGLVLKAADHLDNITSKLKKINATKLNLSGAISSATRGFNNLKNSVFNLQNSLIGLAAAGIGADILNTTAKLSDTLAIVQKNTGLTTQEMEGLKKTIDSMNTRTSTEDLLNIASMGGKLGVAKNELDGFVQVIDKATVALGDEFGNSAETVATVLGKLKGQYKEFSNVPFEDSLNRIGSAINYLGKQGANSAPNVADFTQRISTLGLGIADAAGLGATLEELGLSAEIASGGLKNVLTLAKTETGAFAKQLGMTVQGFEQLINTNPNQVILDLAKSLKGASATTISQTLKGLKIGSQESQAVVQLLSGNLDKLTERQSQANKALKEGTDLQGEANLMQNTLGARVAMLGKAFEQLKVAAGTALVPAFEGGIALGMKFFKTIEANLGNIGNVFSALVSALNPVFVAIQTTIESVFGKSTMTISGFFTTVIGYINQAAPIISGVVSVLQPILRFFLDGVRGVFEGLKVVWEGLLSVFDAVVEPLASLYNSFSNAISIGDMFQTGLTLIGWALRALAPFLRVIIILLSPIIKLFFNLVGILSKVYMWFVKLFGGVIIGMVQGVGDAISYVVDGLVSMLQYIGLVGGEVDKNISKANQIKKVDDQKRYFVPKVKGQGILAQQLEKDRAKALGETNSPTALLDSMPTMPAQSAGNQSTQASLAGVSGGGAKQTNINISIGKLNESIQITTNKLSESADDIERIMTELLLRVTNNANQMS